MDDRADSPDSSSCLNLVVVGLGPGGLDRVPSQAMEILSDVRRLVIVRTMDHPAAAELAAQRPVSHCDDIYAEGEDFESVYRAIAVRVVETARSQNVVYATPGSPLVGERAVPMIRSLAAESGMETVVHPAESFLDAALAELGVDSLERGLTVLNAHRLPSPLLLRGPTIVGALDTPVGLADFCAALSRIVPEGTEVTVLVDLGGPNARMVRSEPGKVDPALAGPRTSVYVDAPPVGLPGAVAVMERLRSECPWDRRQTHQSLIKNLVEETYELAEVLAVLPREAGAQGASSRRGQPDWMAMAEVSEELGDVLLQVLFHSVIAGEAGIFDIEDVAEGLRRKLVRRHPHVFSDVVVDSAEQVKANWEQIKKQEKPSGGDHSLMDGVPLAMPALARAAKIQRRAAQVGFDWAEVPPVVEKVAEELEELREALSDPESAQNELGDLLFACVNLSRHLNVDPETALRQAIAKFSRRFRLMEGKGSLEGLGAEEMERRWKRAKQLGH
ncbi:MAG: nucleoside triphosphate pyrophosphohydrolase [Actinomycetia bacterium]|nr:nucleoside triphosphate pyrophosphohydrolase [Actinomycetes bacterium]